MSTDTNVFNYFIKVSTSILLGNIFTMHTHNDTLDTLTNCNQTLTTSWTSGSATQDLQAAINGITDGNSLDTFVHTYLANPQSPFPISDYSQAVGATLMNLVATYYANIPNDNASADMSAVNSYNSMIQAQGNNEEQAGQNMAKIEGSVVQTDTSTQQTIANCADAIEGVYGNIAAVIGQPYK